MLAYEMDYYFLLETICYYFHKVTKTFEFSVKFSKPHVICASWLVWLGLIEDGTLGLKVHVSERKGKMDIDEPKNNTMFF